MGVEAPDAQGIVGKPMGRTGMTKHKQSNGGEGNSFQRKRGRTLKWKHRWGQNRKRGPGQGWTGRTEFTKKDKGMVKEKEVRESWELTVAEEIGLVGRWDRKEGECKDKGVLLMGGSPVNGELGLREACKEQGKAGLYWVVKVGVGREGW